MNIAIIYGGRSGEHEVSLVSASFVVRAIGSEHSVHLIGITKNGEWYLQPSSLLEHIRKDTSAVLTIKCDKAARVAVIPGGGTAAGLSVNGIRRLPRMSFFRYCTAASERTVPSKVYLKWPISPTSAAVCLQAAPQWTKKKAK